jgi:5-methylcytosine-specific restriction endonuclease McrA
VEWVPVTVEQLIERDGRSCVWCGRVLWRADLTLEHVVPRSRGGHMTSDNALIACRSCNRRRGHTAPSQWLEAAQRPRREVVERSLLALDAAIARRGGQRKARPYLESQLRRLRKRTPVAA